MDPGEIVQELPDLPRFSGRKVAASGCRNRSVARPRGPKRTQAANGKNRQALDLGRVQCTLDSVLIEEPRAENVLVIEAENESQTDLVDLIRRKRVGFAEHDLARGQIDEALLVGRVRQRGGKIVFTEALGDPPVHVVLRAEPMID